MTAPAKVRLYSHASDLFAGSLWIASALASAATVYFGGTLAGSETAPTPPSPDISVDSPSQRQRTDMLPNDKRPDAALVAKVRLAAMAITLPSASETSNHSTRITAPHSALPRTFLAPTAPSTVWDDIAQCESSGNWSINTGNGFHGGLQFTASTWKAFGGTRYASAAEHATREQQIVVAQEVQASQGWNAWPVCSKKAHAANQSRTKTVATAPATMPAHSSHAARPAHQPTAAPAPTPVPPAAVAPSTPTLTNQASPSQATTVLVQAGDSLSTIATRHNIKGGWQWLYQQNKTQLTNPHLIRPGERLNLPMTGANTPPDKAASDTPNEPVIPTADKTAIDKPNADKTADKTAVTTLEPAKHAAFPSDPPHPAKQSRTPGNHDHYDRDSGNTDQNDTRSQNHKSDLALDSNELILTGPPQKQRAWLTGHPQADKSNNKNANKLSDPVVHDEPGGTGTYNDPISASVPPGADRVWQVGARFYVPALQRYAIVEDTGASMPPSDQEGHLDLWIGEKTGKTKNAKTALDECLNKINRENAPVVLNPPSDLPTTPGPLLDGNTCHVPTAPQ